MPQLLAGQEIFRCPKMSTPGLGASSFLFNKYCSSFNRIMCLQCNVDRSHRSSAVVKSECCYTAIHVTTPPFPIYTLLHLHSQYTHCYTSIPNIHIATPPFPCAIIIKSDYSRFAVDVLYPIMQQWPWWPIADTEGEDEVTVLPSLPPSTL